MADIKIKQTTTTGDHSAETTVEITGADYIREDLIKLVLDCGQAGQPTAPEGKNLAWAKSPAGALFIPSTFEADFPLPYNMRKLRPAHVSPAIIGEAKRQGRLDTFIQPFDEIDIPLDTGGTVTVVCGYVEPEWARFVLKDCWDEAVMNEENTNKTGYFKSKGRAHVLVDILPHIAQEWREIFKPRQMVEEIGGERVEYADLMWLPSATDVFGPSEEGYWKDLDDSFQLPIFKQERDRVKECGDEGTYPYWLRSVSATSASNFRLVSTDGSYSNCSAYYSYGFAPGFDI